MGDPVASISVPKDEKIKFKEQLPLFLERAAVDGKPATLSGMVQRMVFDSQVLDKSELQTFASKEQLTSREKYLILILE